MKRCRNRAKRFNNAENNSVNSNASNTSSKKGSVSLGFNWIFVIIAGALVVIILTNIIMKQKDVNDQQNAFKIKNAINSQIREGLAPSSGLKEFKLPKSTFSFTCSNSGASNFKIGDHQQDLAFAPVYAPRSVKTNTLLMWSKQFDIPYPVGSALYITSPEIRYLFLTESGQSEYAQNFISGLYSKFPEQLTAFPQTFEARY